MHCRHCGTEIREDSFFCFHCGGPVQDDTVKRKRRVLSRLRLNSPYTYTAVLLAGFSLWALQPDRPPVDYSQVRLELELRGESDHPEENIYRHHMSLIVENLGTEPVAELPVQIRARLQPDQPAEIVSDFLGRQMVIFDDGDSIPLVVILADELASGEKRRYAIDGIVLTHAPAKVTYEILTEGADDVLTALDASIPSPQQVGPPGGPIALYPLLLSDKC